MQKTLVVWRDVKKINYSVDVGDDEEETRETIKQADRENYAWGIFEYYGNEM